MEGLNENSITLIGKADWRAKKQLFGIKRRDRGGHVYIIGKTGTGKSTLILNMLVSDIRRGEGIALIDPHGDLAEELLDYIPSDRLNDVIYFNPADMECPVAFNPLEKVEPDHYHLVASGIISVLKKLWPDFWGPRMEHIIRHSVLTLLEYPDSSLLDLPRLLTDKEFRKEVVEKVTQRQVRDFWAYEFEKYSAWIKSEAVAPILSRVGHFLTAAPLRNVIGQRKNTFDLRDVMDSGKILIVNLSKGKIGEDGATLLGAMIVTKIQLAALSRSDVDECKRRPFYLYVDEVHNFLTLSFTGIFAESRKYGLNLTIAHQYIDQLDERIRAAVFGNVGTIISFRIGAEDAKYLAREFYPVFNESDFVNLPNHSIYLKLMIDGFSSRPFSAATLPAYEKHNSFKAEIINASQKKYGKPRKKVEGELLFINPFEVKKRNPRQCRLFK
jgi:type IV secretory pathway TraG/TraD family ATPase VirD4